MKQIIRLTESDLHRLVKESVRRILAETDASSSGDVNRPVFPIVSRPSIVGEPINKKVDKLRDDASDRTGGDNHSLSVNIVGEANWKNAILGGMMAMSPMQGNAQTQDYNPNRQDRNSVEALTKQYNKTYSIKELVQMFPQAYVDRNANPEVWIENARQGKYTPTVKDNGDGRYRTMMVAYIAAKNGQNPWDALVKRYCPNQIGKTYKIGDF